jgi:hypothetical protein
MGDLRNEWEDLKHDGETHYKTGKVEPIDLYRSGGMLKHFALSNIIKYSFRNAKQKISENDIDKIIHYAKMLKVLCHEGE